MPKPDPMPNGTALLSDDSERAKDTFACVDMMMDMIDQYIAHHPEPAIAMQNTAVAAIHVAGIVYGRLNILDIVTPTLDDLLEVIRHNFESGYKCGALEMTQRIIADVIANGPQRNQQG